MILTFFYVAMSFILYANAEGLRQCGDPYHPVNLDNVEIKDCAKDETCKVYNELPQLHYYINYTATKDYPVLEGGYVYYPVCRVQFTAPSNTEEARCSTSLVIEKDKKEKKEPYFESIKNGDQFYLHCDCLTFEKFKEKESGTFNVTTFITVHGKEPDEDVLSYTDCVKGDIIYLSQLDLEEDEDETDE